MNPYHGTPPVVYGLIRLDERALLPEGFDTLRFAKPPHGRVAVVRLGELGDDPEWWLARWAWSWKGCQGGVEGFRCEPISDYLERRAHQHAVDLINREEIDPSHSRLLPHERAKAVQRLIVKLSAPVERAHLKKWGEDRLWTRISPATLADLLAGEIKRREVVVWRFMGKPPCSWVAELYNQLDRWWREELGEVEK